jgi:hypothetical protein
MLFGARSTVYSMEELQQLIIICTLQTRTLILKEAVQTSEELLATSVLGGRRPDQTEEFYVRILPNCTQRALSRLTPNRIQKRDLYF